MSRASVHGCCQRSYSSNIGGGGGGGVGFFFFFFFTKRHFGSQILKINKTASYLANEDQKQRWVWLLYIQYLLLPWMLGRNEKHACVCTSTLISVRRKLLALVYESLPKKKGARKRGQACVSDTLPEVFFFFFFAAFESGGRMVGGLVSRAGQLSWQPLIGGLCYLRFSRCSHGKACCLWQSVILILHEVACFALVHLYPNFALLSEAV